MRSTTSDVVFDCMFEAKKTKSKIIPGIILLVAAISIYIWWDKRQYDQCKSLLSAKIYIPKDRRTECYQRVYGVNLSKPTFGFIPDPTPLKPDREVYNIGEKITYGYLTIKVLNVDRSYTGIILVDIYEYNDAKNTGIININTEQFYLERPDKSRIETYDIGIGNRYNRTLKPDEGVTAKVEFRVKDEERNNLNILKIKPFEGSPSLTINLNI